MLKSIFQNIKRIFLAAVIAAAVFSACGRKQSDSEIKPTATPVEVTVTVAATKAPITNPPELSPQITEEVRAEITATETPAPTPTVIPVYSSEPSMDKFLRTALKPVGTTLYVWGGGWNEEDTGAGKEARTLGISKEWLDFFEKNDKTYNYKAHDYEIHKGLDCSGYVGWTLYNTLENKNGEDGYVCSSTDMAGYLIERGLGYEIPSGDVLLAGDIVSMNGHVYISLGTCDDGSVLLLHSSPPGVRISGTKDAEGKETEAMRIAAEYTKTHFPLWYRRYNEISEYGVGSSYKDSVKRFRWSEEVFDDGKEFRALSPEAVLKKLDGLPDKAEFDTLLNGTESGIYINVGAANEYAKAIIQVEHMLRFKEDAAHIGVPGYEWLSFGVRVIIEDEKAFEEGYNYSPFITNVHDINGMGNTDEHFTNRISHIKSGVYESENGEKRICDTFQCELLIPEKSEDYAFGFVDTSRISAANSGFSGDNHLALFQISLAEADTVKSELSSEIKKGDFVKTENKEDSAAVTWVVIDENEDELTLLSLYVIGRHSGDFYRDMENMPEVRGPSEKEIITFLWKNGLGYDTIVAAAPSLKCLEELAEFRDKGLPEDMVFYDYALSEDGKYCGADGIGEVNRGGGSLLDLICCRPCIKIKKSDIH